jgi:hypothetical protein
MADHDRLYLVIAAVDGREKSPGWKGGKYVECAGYVRIMIPTHHRADRDGYVLEHIVVYEDHHRCCILPCGAVHHINHIKSV